MNSQRSDDGLLEILGDLAASLRAMHERQETLRARIATLEERLGAARSNQSSRDLRNEPNAEVSTREGERPLSFTTGSILAV